MPVSLRKWSHSLHSPGSTIPVCSVLLRCHLLGAKISTLEHYAAWHNSDNINELGETNISNRLQDLHIKQAGHLQLSLKVTKLFLLEANSKNFFHLPVSLMLLRKKSITSAPWHCNLNCSCMFSLCNWKQLQNFRLSDRNFNLFIYLKCLQSGRRQDGLSTYYASPHSFPFT